MPRRGEITLNPGYTLPNSGALSRSMLQRVLSELVGTVNLLGVGDEEIADVSPAKFLTGQLSGAGIQIQSNNYLEDVNGNCTAGWALKGDGSFVSAGLKIAPDGTVTVGAGGNKLLAQPTGDFTFGIGGKSLTIKADGTIFVGGTDVGTAPFSVSPAGDVTVLRTDSSAHAIDISAIGVTVLPPLFTPDGGAFDTALNVSLVNRCTGSSLYYTTDASTPTTSSTLYTGTPIALSATTTIKAIAVKFGVSSTVATKVFTKNASVGDKVASPTFSPAPGTYTPTGGGQAVTISCPTSGATIRYTTDGTTPSSSAGTIIASGSSVTLTTGTTTLKAIAYKGGSTDSDVVSGSYVINSGGTGGGTQVATPDFVVDIGTEGVSAVTGHLTCSTSGVTFHWRKWGGTSWGSWQTTSTSILVPLNQFIEFYASKAGLVDSDLGYEYNY